MQPFICKNMIRKQNMELKIKDNWEAFILLNSPIPNKVIFRNSFILTIKDASNPYVL